MLSYIQHIFFNKNKSVSVRVAEVLRLLVAGIHIGVALCCSHAAYGCNSTVATGYSRSYASLMYC